MLNHGHFNNWLWPSHAIRQHRSGSILVQVMAYCLTAPSHYLNQCLFNIIKVQWLSPKSNFTGDTLPSTTEISLKITDSKFLSSLIVGNESDIKRKSTYLFGEISGQEYHNKIILTNHKKQNLNVSCLILQSSLPNTLRPGVKFRTRTTRTPAFWGYPPTPNDYPYHWVILDPKSKEDKVKVTNLKNSPKFQIVEFWNGHYTRHTFWSCLIRCANMKWILWVLLKIQSGHDSVHRWTDGQGDTSIPHFQLRLSGGIITINSLVKTAVYPLLTLWMEIRQSCS